MCRKRLNSAVGQHFEFQNMEVSNNLKGQQVIISVTFATHPLAGAVGLTVLQRTMQEEAPCSSACTYTSPGRKYRLTNASFCCASLPLNTK